MNKLLVLSVALVACLSLAKIDAQKTISGGQQSWSGGSGQNSVYGGYGSNAAPVSPVRQQLPKRPATSSNSKFSQQSIRQQSFQRPQPVAQPFVQQQQQQESSSYNYESSNQQSQQSEADAEPASYGSVSGQPGRDFPNYSQVPKTSFSCEGLPYNEYGMYADEETGCQAYHLCYNGRKDSFLCGPGTVFNQRILHCDYWYSVDCAKSSQYYSSNAYMGSSQPEPGPAQANAAPAQAQQSYSSSSSSRQSSYQRPPVQVGRQQSASSTFSRNNIQQQTEDSY